MLHNKLKGHIPTPTYIRSQEIALKKYVLFQFHNSFYIGKITHIDDEDDECAIKFMKPKFPAKMYCWPGHDDSLDVSFKDIISLVELSSLPGEQYRIAPRYQDELIHLTETWNRLSVSK